MQHAADSRRLPGWRVAQQVLGFASFPGAVFDSCSQSITGIARDKQEAGLC